MNILVLNGSPRGSNSNTMHITNAFLEGLNSKKSNKIEVLNIINYKISPCRGCFSCWKKTNGKCVIDDDMSNSLIEKYKSADIVIWSFPLYYFGMPSHLKAFLDRLLPLNMPQINKESDGSNSHSARYNLSNKKYVLISTCGFGTVERNYESLIKQFDRIYNNYEKIICPEGELFNQPCLYERKIEYLGFVKAAGSEFIENNKFSSYINERLSELLCDEDLYIEMANSYWNGEESIINSDNNFELQEDDVFDSNKNSSDGYNFMKFMKNGYNLKSYKKDKIIEFYFTNLDETYQLILTKDKCILKTNNFIPYTTRIESSLELWKDICDGKVNGAEALMKRKYKVKGNLATLIKMHEYFN